MSLCLLNFSALQRRKGCRGAKVPLAPTLRILSYGSYLQRSNCSFAESGDRGVGGRGGGAGVLTVDMTD